LRIHVGRLARGNREEAIVEAVDGVQEAGRGIPVRPPLVSPVGRGGANRHLAAFDQALECGEVGCAGEAACHANDRDRPRRLNLRPERVGRTRGLRGRGGKRAGERRRAGMLVDERRRDFDAEPFLEAAAQFDRVARIQPECDERRVGFQIAGLGFGQFADASQNPGENRAVVARAAVIGWCLCRRRCGHRAFLANVPDR
jgi:hypothetical protein